MNGICFWTVGDGDYAYMAQALVNSFYRWDMEGDFHVFSDRNIVGATTHDAGKFDKRGCFFKLDFLLNRVKEWDYRYFIYVDADTLFLRKPPMPLIDLLDDDLFHLFLESDCTNIRLVRKKWWGIPLLEYVRLMQECGVSTPCIYNVNGGFFVIQKQAIDVVCNLAVDFAKYAKRQGYALPDEPALAYAMHILCHIPENHLLSRYWDVWCSDWEGVFKERLPSDHPWLFRDYMSREPHFVNPSIVHLLRSKSQLIQIGKSSQFV